MWRTPGAIAIVTMQSFRHPLQLAGYVASLRIVSGRDAGTSQGLCTQPIVWAIRVLWQTDRSSLVSQQCETLMRKIWLRRTPSSSQVAGSSRFATAIELPRLRLQIRAVFQRDESNLVISRLLVGCHRNVISLPRTHDDALRFKGRHGHHVGAQDRHVVAIDANLQHVELSIRDQVNDAAVALLNFKDLWRSAQRGS